MRRVRDHWTGERASAAGRARCWLLAALMLGCLGARAASDPASAFVLPAGERLRIDEFSAHVQLLEDASGKLGIAEVSGPASAGRFVAATLAAANIGFTESVWWARFTLRNDSARERSLFLRQTYPLIDYVDFYAVADGGQWLRRATGDRQPFATREVRHRDFVFSLDVPAGSERTFYLRYQSQGPIDISLALYDSHELLGSLSREQLAYGIYFGCVLMLLVWAALVFIGVRDSAFLAYFTYVGTFGLYMLVNNGVAFQFFWPDSPHWGNAAVIVLLSLALLAGLQFSRMILHARTYTPKLDRVAQGLQALGVLALIATPLLDYAHLIMPVTALVLASVIFMLVLGIASVVSGSRPAKFYLIAWSAFLAGSIIYLLKAFGVLPHTLFTQHSWQVGSLLEMILLSMTLSSRMNELQHQTRTDPLTLLGNRRLFSERLQAEFVQARELGRPLALLVLDIDSFKRYNDQHGHARGDDALKAVANIVRRYARRPCIACRHGGEEFTVILPGADGAAAAFMAERLRRSVHEALDGDLAITISVGVASMPDRKFEAAEKLFEAADFALYSAKAQGRNRVVVFSGRRVQDQAGLSVSGAGS